MCVFLCDGPRRKINKPNTQYRLKPVLLVSRQYNPFIAAGLFIYKYVTLHEQHML